MGNYYGNEINYNKSLESESNKFEIQHNESNKFEKNQTETKKNEEIKKEIHKIDFNNFETPKNNETVQIEILQNEKSEKDNIFKIDEKEEYNHDINYLDKNPYSNIFKKGTKYTGYGATLFSTIVFDSTLTGFFATPIAFSVLGGTALMGFGIFMAIAGAAGTGMHKIYKKYNENKLSKFFNELQNSEKMKEEREIYIEVLKNMNNYVMKFMKSKNEDNIKINIIDILKKIMNIFLREGDIILEKQIEEYIKKYSNISKFNILIVGKTGVGKSTLINGVLNLNKNNAVEGNDAIPQKIEGFIKKYPINEEDCDIKNLNLWDTEGIEFSDLNNNDIKTHLKKIKNYITSHLEIPNEQINCIWYCVNGNRLEEEDKKYIESLLNTYEESKIMNYLKTAYENFKFPIIFVYTKAFDSESENIDTMEKALLKLDYYKNHQNELNFIDVIAKSKTYKKKRTGKTETENKLNLKKLIEESCKLGKKAMALPLLLSSNILCKELNNKAKKMLNKIKDNFENLRNTILMSNKDNTMDIFNEAIPFFNKLIKALCQENLDLSKQKEIDLLIEKIDEIIKEILNLCINRAISNFNKQKFIDSFQFYLLSQYTKKNDKNLNKDDFIKKCNNYLITPFADNIMKYSILILFSYIRDIIFDYAFNEHNNCFNRNKDKIKEEFKKNNEENYKQFMDSFIYNDEDAPPSQ